MWSSRVDGLWRSLLDIERGAFMVESLPNSSTGEGDSQSIREGLWKGWFSDGRAVFELGKL